MNPRLHAELAALAVQFHSEGISDEEWALLQVDMAYCDVCRSTFEMFKDTNPTLLEPGASAGQQRGLTVRSIKWRRFSIVAGMVAIVAAIAQFCVYPWYLRTEAASLLADVKSLRVGATTAQDARRVAERHARTLSSVKCETNVCTYNFVVSNWLLSWTHALPLAEFRAGYAVADGKVDHIYAVLLRAMPIYPSFQATAGGVEEYAELPPQDQPQRHYDFPTPIGKPYLRVELDRHAEAVQREHAFKFSFTCLTKLGGGCDVPCLYLPDAWKDWRADLEKSGFPMADFETVYHDRSRCA